MGISKSILRFLSPEYEKHRMDFRILASTVMAQSEDIDRTVKGINGHAAQLSGIIFKKFAKKDQ